METQEAPTTPTLAPEVPLDATIFRFPSHLAWMMGGISLFFIAILLFALSMQFTHLSVDSILEIPLFIAVYGSCAALSLHTLNNVRASVAVNSEGVWYIPYSEKRTFFSWSEIASVKAHDTLQQLGLSDATGKQIKLSYQLAGFATLRDFVLDHTAEAARLPATGLTLFHRSWLGKSALLLATLSTLIVAGIIYHFGYTPVALFIMIYAVVLLVLVTRDVSQVVITNKAVIIKYPGWERKIPFDTITGIVLKNVPSRGSIWATVIIETRHDKPLELRRFREGSIALRHGIETAWIAATKDHVLAYGK